MQLNNVHRAWLNKRGITDEVLRLFNITTYDHPTIGECIRIPYSKTHAKYRRDPRDDRKPKYLYDSGGKVTLYGADHLLDVDGGPVLLTEGESDALVAWSHNIPAVSSTGGAMSFQEEWVGAFLGHDVYLCFDNDEAGAKGMVKVLKYLPHAKVVIIPNVADVKDVSDYVARGGDLHALLTTAIAIGGVEDVEADMKKRQPTFQPTTFHKAYLDEHRKESRQNSYRPGSYAGDDKVLKAKSYPLTELIEFNRERKACCRWHKDNSPSLHYYAKTNSAYCFGCSKLVDSIDAYMAIHNVGFKEAVEALHKMV